ncbi:MAG: site-2 protease family protein [Oscillospiraceae bacterium]|jgi:hypothetical protein|nr:site-2 protease family protein [Oscillospiraceae bacterium]
MINTYNVPDFAARFLSKTIFVFLVLPVIQYFICLIAYKLGDDSPEMQARLTLNPIAHIDWMGALFVFLCGMGWPKPLPINSANFYKVKDRRTGKLIVALAGPCGGLLFAFIFTFLSAAIGVTKIAQNAFGISFCYVFWNAAILCIFVSLIYIIPIPGTPGEEIGEYFFPNVMAKMRRIQPLIFIVFLILMYSQSIVSVVFSKLAAIILKIFYSLSSSIISLIMPKTLSLFPRAHSHWGALFL